MTLPIANPISEECKNSDQCNYPIDLNNLAKTSTAYGAASSYTYAIPSGSYSPSNLISATVNFSIPNTGGATFKLPVPWVNPLIQTR
jgi:hypothetical protein